MITKQTKHDKCQVEIVTAGENSQHYASLRCIDCNKWIQWLSLQDALALDPNFTPNKKYTEVSMESLGL